MIKTKNNFIFCAFLLLPLQPVFAQSVEPISTDTRFVDAQVRGKAQNPAEGKWAVKTHLVWNEETDQLTRQTYEVWQSPLESELTFRWTPDVISDAKQGRVSGQGTVVWRDIGAATYEHDATVAIYMGHMREGKREGEGVYRHKSGFSYDGTWQAGKMHGTGYLTLTNGDHYVGGFKQGKLHGEGRLIDSDGTIFEGTFVDGKAQGEGLVKRSDDLEYLAVWKDGDEVAGSRNIVYEPKVLNAQLSDDFRVGVVLENRSGQSNFSNLSTSEKAAMYKSRATGETLSIFPASQRILDVWRGNAPLTMEAREAGDRHSGGGFLGIKKEDIKPVSLVFEFENKSRSDVRITSSSLLVDSSKTDRDPMLHAFKLIDDCSGPGEAFAPDFLLENFGWSEIENGKMTLQFVDTQDAPIGSPEVLNIPNFSEEAFVNLVPVLAKKGANVAALKRGHQCAAPASYTTESLNAAKRNCIKTVQSSAGELGPAMAVNVSGLQVGVKGNIDYQWRDNNGTPVNKSGSFKLQIPVGAHNMPLAECGEGGSPGDATVKIFRLKLDQENYRLRVPIKDTVPAGVTSRWRLAFEAEKNSNHRFRLQFNLSDGQTIVSRPIDLAYLRPRIPK
ncbi:MORN repeat-containing protein [Sulfitobacter donghicola]|uniref:MORN repeat protein n=1 Tax=Sulfitobacter donghicola DSW-25 = KCTC 12864 = JCM 14565 TaxID=1300350 RepID=A0A073IJH1_9RHOB|nr:hypothetical protein [Sulfitobacter donghicola]KEJ89661.1 hypothetical protein DSW25_11145 [Sulfitobacter donghicola DSW-25 = KCTC 12864 = JCM 14565]